MKRIFLLIFFLFNLGFNSNSQVWNTDMGDTLRKVCTGCDSNVWVSNLLSVKNRLFIAGGFTYVGSNYSFGITYWKNNHFFSLNSLEQNGLFYSLNFYKNKLYVGGSFHNFNGINNLDHLVVWDGNNWDFVSHASFDINSDNTINTMQWLHDTLFIGGGLGYIDGIYRNSVAQWNGANWLNMEHGVDGGLASVYCSEIYNDQIHIAGVFNSVSGHVANNVARWNGHRWYSVGPGLNAYHVMTLYKDTTSNLLYAGGTFNLFGDPIAANIASWNEQQWSKLPINNNYDIQSLCSYRGKFYSGGTFTTLMKWNGSSWDSITHVDNTILTMTVFNDELIVGGYFSEVNGIPAKGIARYYEPPDSACLYFAPQVYTDKDTFYIHHDTANVQLYSNSLHGSAWLWNFGDSSSSVTARMPLHNYNNPGHYTVSLTLSEAHCTKTTYKNIVVLDTVTAVAKQAVEKVGLRIYPNPASGSVTIELNISNDIEGNICITDIKGNQKANFEISKDKKTISVDTSKWSKGTYNCSLIIKGKTVKVEKLVVE